MRVLCRVVLYLPAFAVLRWFLSICIINNADTGTAHSTYRDGNCSVRVQQLQYCRPWLLILSRYLPCPAYRLPAYLVSLPPQRKTMIGDRFQIRRLAPPFNFLRSSPLYGVCPSTATSITAYIYPRAASVHGHTSVATVTITASVLP
jgi:hypothetical protein